MNTRSATRYQRHSQSHPHIPDHRDHRPANRGSNNGNANVNVSRNRDHHEMKNTHTRSRISTKQNGSISASSVNVNGTTKSNGNSSNNRSNSPIPRQPHHHHGHPQQQQPHHHHSYPMGNNWGDNNHSNSNGNTNGKSNNNSTHNQQQSHPNPNEKNSFERKNHPLSLNLHRAASPIVIPPKTRIQTMMEDMQDHPNNNNNNTSNSSIGLNRPESRCSQHSAASATSSQLPASRTTTSRRGGRVSRSRSPLVFTSRSNGSSTVPLMKKSSPTSSRGGYGPSRSTSPLASPTSPIQPSSTSPTPDVQLSLNSNKKSSSSMNNSSNNSNVNMNVNNPNQRVHRNGEQCSFEGRNHEKENTKIEMTDGRRRNSTDTVSSAAAKAAAEAALWLSSRLPESFVRKMDHSENKGRHSDPKLGLIELGEESRLERLTLPGQQQDEEHNREKGDSLLEGNLNRSSGLITTRSKSRIEKPSIGSGGTSFVIGAATPMHVPRARPNPSLQPKDRFPKPQITQRNQSSPDYSYDGNEAAPPGSPQRMLLDLKNSKSFELRSPIVDLSSSPKSHCPLSPQEPPRIQTSHHQANNLFFPRTPKTPKTPKSPSPSISKRESILGTPSFHLFNQDFDSFDDNDDFAIPTPNPNNNPSLLDNDLRSPALSLVRSIDGCSPRKTLLNSPYLEGFGASFSPQKSPKPITRRQSKNIMIGAPPMPHVTFGETQEAGDDEVKSGLEFKKKSVLEFKGSAHRPIKKRIMDQEKKSPVRPIEAKSEPQNDIAMSKIPTKPIQRPKVEEMASDNAGYDRMPPYQSHPLPPNDQRPHPYHHKFGTHNMSKIRGPSLSGMEAPYFYQRLSCHKEAFSRFTFLLPGLESIIKASKGNSEVGTDIERVESQSDSVNNEAHRKVKKIEVSRVSNKGCE